MNHPARISDHLARDLVDPQSYADWSRIHETYRELRRTNPIARVEYPGFDPFLAITKHADIKFVSRQNELFINNGARAGLASQSSFAQQAAAADSMPILRSLVMVDGMNHKKLRSIAAPWLTPGHIAALENQIREIAKEAIAKMILLGGRVDFVKEVALHYPLSVIRSILGVPASDEAMLLKMTQEFFAPNDPELNPSELSIEDLSNAKSSDSAVLMEFLQYFADLTAARRKHPTGDLASIIANARMDDELISDWDATSYYITIATAGHDTTSASTGGAMWALCEHPHLLRQLQADPSLITGFIEEAVRWTTPIQHFMRTAVRDTEISGHQIKAGDWLMLCYPSGNRDEDVFERPYEFDITRPFGKQMGFGHGGHFCLGTHLARLEMRIFYEELIPLIESVRIFGEPKRIASVFIGGPKTLPVEITYKPSAQR